MKTKIEREVLRHFYGESNSSRKFRKIVSKNIIRISINKTISRVVSFSFHDLFYSSEFHSKIENKSIVVNRNRQYRNICRLSNA